MTDSDGDGVDNGGDDTKDNVKDKLSQRFESEEENASQPVSGGESSTGKSSKGPNSANTSKSSEESKSSKSSEGSVTDWKNHSFYLPEDLADQLSIDYKKLDWQLDEQLNQDLKKTRHYYPLIVELGLERLEDLDPDEIADRI